MEKRDVIYAIICGLAVAWIALDFFGFSGWILFIILPILSIIGLWLTELIGKKLLFVHQAGKFGLAGAFADVIDIKVFQFLFWLVPFSSIVKSISFLVATAVKYWTNKHWAFKQHKNDDTNREAINFFVITFVGLGLNVVSFYFFGRIKTGLPDKMWQELSIIFSALVAAVWNFCGYKFIVFKK